MQAIPPNYPLRWNEKDPNRFVNSINENFRRLYQGVHFITDGIYFKSPEGIANLGGLDPWPNTYGSYDSIVLGFNSVAGVESVAVGNGLIAGDYGAAVGMNCDGLEGDILFGHTINASAGDGYNLLIGNSIDVGNVGGGAGNVVLSSGGSTVVGDSDKNILFATGSNFVIGAGCIGNVLSATDAGGSLGDSCDYNVLLGGIWVLDDAASFNFGMGGSGLGVGCTSNVVFGYNTIGDTVSECFVVGANISTGLQRSVVFNSYVVTSYSFVTGCDYLWLGRNGETRSGQPPIGPCYVTPTYPGVIANTAGVSLNLRGGQSTGSAAGGNLAFWTSPAGGAGSTLNAYVERMRIASDGTISFPSGTLSGYVPTSRTVSTTTPLAGGGDLSANRTLTLAGLSGLGSSGDMLRSTGAAWEYRTAVQVLSDISAQPLDATLTSLSSLGTAADKLAYTTGIDTWAETAITVAGRALIDDADAAAQRTTLGLGTAATAASSDFAAASHTHAYTDVVSVPTDRLLGRDTAGTGAAEALTVGGGLEFTGSGGVQRSALSGDVTASAGSGTTAIANDAVTYAKMQNVSATDKLLGRSTAGAGDVEEIACTTAGRALLDDADAAAQRTTLGLGTAATAASSDFAAATHAHAASDITSGTVATARLGSGTASGSTFLRGDQTWATPAGGTIDGTGSAGQVASWVDSDTLTGITQGAGGGLNADTVDGQHASAFAAASHTHTSADVTDFTEAAQDAVGAMVADTATIDVTYTDATPELKWDIKTGSVTLAMLANLATDRLIGRDTAGTGVPEALTVGGGIEFTGSGGIQRSALTGDVTASAGSGATTIANDTVTYAKMQNVSATDKLLGRSTAGAGDVEEIACTSAGRALLDDADASAQRTTLGAAASATTISAGTGLIGGGDLSANRTLSLDINGLTAETAPATGDSVAIYDTSEGAVNKCTLANLLRGVGTVGFAAYLTADQTIPTSTWARMGDNSDTADDLDMTVLFDSDNAYDDGGSGGYTIPYTGNWLLLNHSNWDTLSATGVRIARVISGAVAGGPAAGDSVLASDTEVGSASVQTGGKLAIVSTLSATTVIGFDVWQNQGGNMNLDTLSFCAAIFLGV